MTTTFRKNIVRVAFVTAGLLLIPLFAMRFTDQVKWGSGDFVIAATLLFGAGVVYVLAADRVHGYGWKLVVGGAVLVGLGLVWAELAVGLFG
jgi:hypothetical protein